VGPARHRLGLVSWLARQQGNCEGAESPGCEDEVHFAKPREKSKVFMMPNLKEEAVDNN
jgi:hypothetical protein